VLYILLTVTYWICVYKTGKIANGVVHSKNKIHNKILISAEWLSGCNSGRCYTGNVVQLRIRLIFNNIFASTSLKQNIILLLLLLLFTIIMTDKFNMP